MSYPFLLALCPPFAMQWLCGEMTLGEKDAVAVVHMVFLMSMSATASLALLTSSDDTFLMLQAGSAVANCMASYQFHNIYYEVKHLAHLLQLERHNRRRELGRDRPVGELVRTFCLNMVHHAATVFAATLCLSRPEYTRLFVYYGGVTEWSTVFLIVLEVGDRWRREAQREATDRETVWRTVVMLGFLVTFLTFRVAGWMFVLVKNWHLVQNDAGLQISVGPLTLLQLYWAKKIVAKARRHLRRGR